ncbi:hypothetical protein H632_c2099p1 [Helicosporidium sp. ATCC 50920]|nr:hypothetical protein H632_c2099p1 [Helicosporidium sp. ATCC 50920]|eukprot:KDD73516.1 hypothetical protein H632_c2099p1 [Helicosporidium sp. ATCC 50920]
MVEHLATAYGDCLVNEPGLESAQGLECLFSSKLGGGDVDPPRFWAFPSLSQLARADEAALRAAGFGYRARYVASAARSLLEKEVENKQPSACPGEAWLDSLRGPAMPSARAVEELCSLAGVGPKVAACVALFALNHTALVPVDVHVHRLAGRHYLPAVKSAALTPALHPLIQEAFARRFGEFAGWAHNALFVSQIRGVQLEEEGEEAEAEDEAAGAKADENEAALARKRELGSPTLKIDPDTPVQDVQDAPKQKRRSRSRG